MVGNDHSCSAPECDKVDDSLMVSCDRCKRWWHFSCADFDPKKYDTATPWFCRDSTCVETPMQSDNGASLETESDTVTVFSPSQDVLATSLDVLMEAAVVAQASVAQKDIEIVNLRKQLEEVKLKLSSATVLDKKVPTMDNKPIPSAEAKVKLTAERLQMLRNIQANHKNILKNLQELKGDCPITNEYLESTALPGTCNRRTSFADSSIQQNDMSSLLTILNRSNIQELPSFSGANKREWLYFEEVFKSTTIEGKYSSKENVARLRKALEGEAYQLVSDRLKYSTDDLAIMDSLRAIFGRPEILVHALTSDLLKLPALKSRSDPNLRMWAVKTNGFVADIKSMKKDEELFNGYVLTDLVGKLGAGLHLEWRKVELAVPRASLKDLADFLAAKVVDLPPDLLKPLEPAMVKKFQPQKSHRQVLTHKVGAKEIKTVCCKCARQEHPLWKCVEFKALTPEKRLELARERSICFSCLDPAKHDWRACSRKSNCGLNNCNGRHHQLLHEMFSKKDKELNSSAVPFVPQHSFVSSHPNTDLPVLYKIAPIRIYGKNDKFLDTFAFLDDGSSITMMERDLFNEMDLDGTSEVLTVQWTKGMSWTEEAIRTDISVSGVKCRKRHFLKGVYCVGDLGLPSQTVDVCKLKELYPHLRGLPLTNLVNAKPKILIGLNQAKFLLGTRQRHGNEEQPTALKTLLGWIVFGQFSNFDSALSLNGAVKPTVRFLYHDVIRAEEDLHDLVKRHFSTEEFGVKPPNGDFVSREDSRALDIMGRTLKLSGKRYEIGLLWKKDDAKLPDNYHMALSRLVTFERALKNKPDLLKWKNEYIQQLLAKGYARVASAEDLEKDWPRVWYAPTFIVENPNKIPPKPRLVVDVAAKFGGTSLNCHLLKGPDNLVPLHAGLFKFRERKVAVNGDVKEMFHQIRIRPEDQQCQRFLWRNGDSSKDPTIYIFEVMMFGPKCSPSCSQFVKNYHSRTFQTECPEAVDGLINRTYVDDYFNSHDSVEEATRVTKDAIRICDSMSFSLVGIQSNDRSFLLDLPESYVNPKIVRVDPSDGKEFVAKILGMFWNPTSDHFTYVLSDNGLLNRMLLPEFVLTKRIALRTLMRVFDPLGLVSIYIIRGRMVLQEIWREGYDWDEPVSASLRTQWLNFVEELRKIENLKIPRRYLSWSPDASKTSLIIFVDASEKAFAATAYFRFEQANVVEVSLVMAKAKVAPVKKLSIPRLELQAAVLGVRLMCTIKDSHTFPIQEVIFLSDSRTVLAWVNSSKFKFPSFVAVRVGEILDSTSPRQWFYIRSADNVADDGTRWREKLGRHHDSRWFRGAEFLKRPFKDWPITSGKVDESELCEEQEMRTLTHRRNPRVSYSVCDEIAPRFRAKWRCLVHVIAYLLRFKNICQRKEENRQIFISPFEFRRAEDWLFRKIQQDAFVTELRSLKTTTMVASSSKIYGLSPFLDDEGTIRLSSRAQNAIISYAARNPAILPKNHELVDVFVQHHHDQNFHVGSSAIISDIRERAWIISIRVVVERVKISCNMCKKIRAKPIMPMMGQLPQARLAFDSKPFTHVGVDCFGPLLVKFGRGTCKRYGMIFTCLTFRAVQIELLNDLGLDQCTMGLRRFLVNRVVTRFLYSDNGLNFIGTNNLLQKDIKEMEVKLSERAARYEGIVWRFIPAYSPWMGGAWERLIKSIKTTIDFILRGVVPREDVLRNALLEAQGQINRRPLTHISVDPEDPRPLTPNSMIFGEDDRDVTAPGIFTDKDSLSRLYSRRSQHLMREFSRRWYKEYLPEITRRSKWYKNTKPVAVGDIVIVIEPNEIQSVWKLGRIIQVYPGTDGIIRTADVRLSNGVLKRKRAVGRLAVLDLESSPIASDGPGSVIEPPQ